MAEAALFFIRNRDYTVGTIKLDLIVSESHSFNNRVTEHSVEDGSEITDHIENELIAGSLVGMVTNFSLAVDGLDTNRAQDAFDEMERLWRQRSLVDIVTVMRVYEDVAITGIQVQRSEQTGEAISMSVSFRQVRVVQLKRVNLDVTINVPDMESQQNRQAAAPADVGKTSGVPVSATEQARFDTLLAEAG